MPQNRLNGLRALGARSSPVPVSSETYRIGTCRFRFRLPDRDAADAVHARLAPFGSRSRPEWTFSVSRGPVRRSGEAPVVLDHEDGLRVLWSRFQAEIRPRRRTASLSWSTNDAVGTFLRVFLSSTRRARGLLVHGAGMLAGSGAALLPGVSGAGKSTFARLAPAGTMLSDELVWVERARGAWRAYGTPFHGDAKAVSAKSAPLRRILFLEKGPRWATRPLARAETARRLLACVMSFDGNGDAARNVLDTVCGLAAEVPAGALSFTRVPPADASWRTLFAL